MGDPVSQEINNLQNGVSQQSPALRFTSQCEDQENCRNDPVRGMGKRFNSVYVGDLPKLTAPGNAVMHTHVRDDVEQYKMVISNGNIMVFDARTGVQYPVSASAAAQRYLMIRGDKTPQQSYQFLSTIDTVFVLNKSMPVRRRKITEPLGESQISGKRTAVIYVGRHPYATQSNPKWSYFTKIKVNGVTETISDHTLSSTHLAAKLATHLEEHDSNVIRTLVRGATVFVDLPAGKNLQAEVLWDVLDENNSRPVGRGDLHSIRYRQTSLPAAPEKRPEALWFIKQADYNTKYKLFLNGTTCSIKTPKSTSDNARAGLQTIAMTAEMKDKINSTTGTHGCKAEQHENTLLIYRQDGKDFTISTSDDLSDGGSYSVKGQAESMLVIPALAVDGFQVEITGEAENVQGSPYYVTYRKDDDKGSATAGIWKESLRAGADEDIDERTMPHALNRVQKASAVTDDNPLGIAFEFVAGEYDKRTVGDDNTAPFPSFVSMQDDDGFITSVRSIHSMVYHKNRLALASDSNLVFSESGVYSNFFPNTVVTTLDGDVIDIALNLNSVAPVEHMVKHAGTLFLFAPRLQMMVTSGAVFAPNSIDIKVLSKYPTELTCAPFVHEGSLHLWDRGDRYWNLYEYLPQGDTERYKALPMTPHVPRYVTGFVVKSVSMQTVGAMFHLTRDESGAPVNYLYVTNVLMQGDKRVQNAWQKWTFAGNVIDIAKLENRLALIMQYEDGSLVMEDITLSHDATVGDIGFPVYLDSRQEVDPEYKLPAGDARASFKNKGRQWVGYPYRQKYVFSTFYPRDNEGTALTSGRLQLRYLTLAFGDTTNFVVEVERAGRIRSKTYEGRIVGALGNTLGDIPVTDGTMRFPVQTRADKASISILNDTPQEALFQSAEWEGTYTRHTRRM